MKENQKINNYCSKIISFSISNSIVKIYALFLCLICFFLTSFAAAEDSQKQILFTSHTTLPREVEKPSGSESSTIDHEKRGKKRQREADIENDVKDRRTSLLPREVTLDVGRFFASHSNNVLQQAEITILIKKGQQIILSLIKKEKPEDIYKKQNLEIFKDRDRFNKGYLSRVPGLLQFSRVIGLSSPADPAVTLRRQQYLEAIIAVSWAIAYAPCVKEQGFVRGSFSIKDDEQLLSGFLGGYAVEAAAVQSGKIADLLDPTKISSSNFVYSRTGFSSHYEEQTVYQIGIDARFESNGYPLPVLPFQNTHILFGRVTTPLGKEKTFFKLEGDGLADIHSILRHGKSWIDPVDNPDLMRREKDIPPVIKESVRETINEVIGWNEKTAQTFLKLENLKTNKKWGSSNVSISEMDFTIKDLLKARKKELKDAVGKANDFLDVLQNLQYSAEDLDYRTGNEVILSLENIVEAHIP